LHGHLSSRRNSDQDTDQYAAWRRRLAEYQANGKVLRADPLIPEPGTYRIRRAVDWASVHIWELSPNKDGEIKFVASLDGQSCEVHTVWPRCAVTPVSAAAYRFYREKGKWPDDVASTDEIPVGANQINVPEHEQILESTKALEAAAIAWFESIGSSVQTQDHADKYANFAARFHALELQAGKARTEALNPILEQARGTRALWSPVEARAATLNRTIKDKWLLPFLSRAKAATGPSDTTPKAGADENKRVAIALRRFAAFSDIREFLKWYIENEPKISLAMTRAALSVARREIRHGNTPPGVEVKEMEQVR
jgi:hypothetical protein